MINFSSASSPAFFHRLTPTVVARKLESFREVYLQIEAGFKLQKFGIGGFQPHVAMQFERGDYLIKTAEDAGELESCLRLRFEVFHKEYMQITRKDGLDIDQLDALCDHLMIVDKRTQKTIGTYRLNSSQFNQTYYSAGEFDLGKIPELAGPKLELGRACIDREFRTGVVIALLWRGIADYIQKTETEVLFGCSSIKTMEPLEIGLLVKHFISTGALSYDFEVQPTKKYRLKRLPMVLDYIEKNPFEYHKQSVQKMIPPLFQSYLRAGAKLCGEPALDREFHCVDFLTCLKIEELHSSMRGKYKV